MENKIFMDLVDVTDGIATFFMLLILIRSFMTWLKQDVLERYYKIFKFVSTVIDPLMNFSAKTFPVRIGRIDFTPLVALFLVEIIKYAVIFVLKLIFRA
ncbi:MAG: YggT family protein [Candidatus Goldiibacteriota bacterium]